MNIVCPECGKSHRLPDDRVPTRKSVAKCKKCSARMVIQPIPASGDIDNIDPADTSLDQNESSSHAYDVLLTNNDKIAEENSPEDKFTTKEVAVKKDDIYGAFPELKELSPEKFVYNEIFTTQGKRGYRNKGNIRKLKIVKAIHAILTKKILHSNEQVFQLTTGISYYPFEFPYANGLLTMLSNYYAIVCTSERLLLININSRITQPTRYIFQLPYKEVSSISRGVFLSSLIIESRIGRRWNFTTVSRKSAKRIKDFVKEQNKKETAEYSEENTRYQLCPACHQPLSEKLTSCPHCACGFKKSTEAMLRAFVLPGVGSIYLSYIPLGILEMVGYVLIWILSVALMIFEVPGGLGVAIAPVIIYHLATSLLAYNTLGKGYLIDK